MDCQQYTEILNVYLDGELPELPHAAQAHAATCSHCSALVSQLTAIRKAAKMMQPKTLTEAAETTILARVQGKIAKTKSARRTFGFATFSGGLRWSRAIFAAAIVGMLIYTYFTFNGGQQIQQEATLAADQEIEILLEEHALQMESGIFQTGTVPARVMVTAASNR